MSDTVFNEFGNRTLLALMAAIIFTNYSRNTEEAVAQAKEILKIIDQKQK